MRWLVLAFLALASSARADNYVVQCTTPGGCLAPDGTLQPNGTYINRIVANPDDISAGRATPLVGTAWVPDTGQQIYE